MNLIEKVVESGISYQKKDLHILEKLASLIFTKKYKKKEYLFREGEVCKEIFYVQKGLLRVYIINDGKEVNTWFVKEGDFITSVGSYHRQMPSDHFIDALEDDIYKWMCEREVVYAKKEGTEVRSKEQFDIDIEYDLKDFRRVILPSKSEAHFVVSKRDNHAIEAIIKQK